MTDMTPERDTQRPENFKAHQADASVAKADEKPWFFVPDMNLDTALQEGKIQGQDSLLITNYMDKGMSIDTYKQDAQGDVREAKLQSLRNRFIDAKSREVNPMDESLADKFISRLENKLTEINPTWNKEQDDEEVLFNKALEAATLSQSPLRTTDVPDQEFNDFMASTEVDTPIQAKEAVTEPDTLRPIEKTIKDSVLKGGADLDRIWVQNNSDYIVKLVNEGHLPSTILDQYKDELKVENAASTPKAESVYGATFFDAKLEYRKVISKLKNDKNLSASEKIDLAAKELQLAQRMKHFEAMARQKGLLKDIDSRYTAFQSDLIVYKDDAMDLEDKNIFEKKVGSWSATDKGNIPHEFQGVREEYAARLKAEIKKQISQIKGSETVFMKQVRNYSEPQIPKRVEGIEKRTPDEQRKAFRFFLEEIESTDKGRFDTTTSNQMSELLKIADRPNIDAEVKAEVKARIHLQACATSLRRVITADPERIRIEFNRAVTNEIGDYALTGGDFETLLQKGLEGLKVQDAFYVMQEAAYRGEFSGKTDETDAAIKRERLVDQILERHKTENFDREAAEKSYDLAMRIAEATFERSVWDTSGGDYLSQAIYFSKWRKDRKKGSQVTIDQIHSIATSFLRGATSAKEKYNDKSVKIINKKDWNNLVDLGGKLISDYGHFNTTKEILKIGRFNQIVLQRIQTTDSNEIIAEQLYPDDAQAKNNLLTAANRDIASANAKGMLHFDVENVNFKLMSSTAYKDYLTTTIPDILDAKDLLTKVDFTAQQLQDENAFQRWGDTLDRVDPYGVMSLRFWFIAGAIDSALNFGMELSEADRIARNLHKDKRSGKGVYIYLKQYLPSGSSVESAIKRITQYERRGLSNAIVNQIEKTVRTRK